MALDAPARIELIKRCAGRLLQTDLEDRRLILVEHGFALHQQWDGISDREYLMDVVRNGDEASMVALDAYLTSEPDQTVAADSPFRNAGVRLFLSHLSVHRELVGRVADVLRVRGIEPFVAHQEIEVSKLWQSVIESALTDCDAMVVFLHPGFGNSDWCDQEVGWVMGRKRPVIVLSFDAMPHGFTQKYQAKKCDGLSASQIADEIATWLASQPSLESRIAESLVTGLRNARSFDATRALMPLLLATRVFTDEQLDRIEGAPGANSQVRGARFQVRDFEPARPVPELLTELVRERRAPVSSGWADDF